jgi:hypothetical protein
MQLLLAVLAALLTPSVTLAIPLATVRRLSSLAAGGGAFNRLCRTTPLSVSRPNGCKTRPGRRHHLGTQNPHPQGF